MASFCKYCGRPLADGEVCHCNTNQQWSANQQWSTNEGTTDRGSSNFDSTGYGTNRNYFNGNATDFWSSMKIRMGLTDQNDDSVYEDGKKIVPDVVKPNEGEVPIRQYEVATLRNKCAGITYAKAKGRIQVTNKRILFRAPGKSIIGTRSSIQHEFAIDEIGGIEARREHILNMGDFFVGYLCAIFGYILSGLFLMLTENGSEFLFYFLAMLLGIGALVPFFMIKKRWLLKMFFDGISVGAFSLAVLVNRNWFFSIFLAAALIILIINGIIYALRPNLVLMVKPKGAASTAIDIRRTNGLGRMFQRSGAGESDDHTGFKEVFPEEGAEEAIRELGAIISDIQKLGDYGIEKWKR